MLPREHRLTDSRGFTAATRGRRGGSRGLVVHVARPDDVASCEPAQVGLVVSKAVGGAVVRTQVKRRLRHLLRSRVAGLPVGSTIAVRALPAAATMTSAELGAELDRCFSRVGLVDVDLGLSASGR